MAQIQAVRPWPQRDIVLAAAVSFLSGSGLSGAMLAAASAVSGWTVGGGCGGLAGLGVLILLVGYGVVLFAYTVLTVGVALGVALMWLHRHRAAVVVMIANLLVLPMFAVFELTDPGRVILCALLIVLASMAVAGAALAAWMFLTSVTPLRDRIIVAVIVAVIASPCLWLYGNGVSSDVATTFAAPQPVAVAGCGASQPA